MNNDFLSKKLTLLRDHCKIELTQQIKLKSKFLALYLKHNDFYKFQKMVLQIAGVLNLDDNLLKSLKSNIGYVDYVSCDDDFDEEKKPAALVKNKGKKDKRKGKNHDVTLHKLSEVESDVTLDFAAASNSVLATAPDAVFVKTLAPPLPQSPPAAMLPVIASSIPTAHVSVPPSDALPAIINPLKPLATNDNEWEVVKPKLRYSENVTITDRNDRRVSDNKHKSELPFIKPTFSHAQSLFNSKKTSVSRNYVLNNKKSPQVENKLVPPPLPPLQSNSIFKLEMNDKIWVWQDELPEELIVFSTFIYNLIKQYLTLTGGSVTSLILKDLIYDFDCLVFYNREKLFILLEKNIDKSKFHIKLVGKGYEIIKIIAYKRECLRV